MLDQIKVNEIILNFPQSRALFEDCLRDAAIQSELAFLKEHHPVSYEHSCRVCQISLELGMMHSLDYDLCVQLGLAALMHDIGKTHISLDILDKASSLDDEETRAVRKHVRQALLTLDQPQYELVRAILAAHHEYSRSPYPRSGFERRQNHRFDQERRHIRADIQVAAEILALSDMLDALVQPRSYKPALPLNEVEHILRSKFTGNPVFIEQALEFFRS
ncbi:MAG: hypothetical protein CVU39_27295 [Chloroflexi bacterium HGW-Chloroflexi-10]|nr:MAG: hypothetical protein CVU39_27295 [Chloroflexi bacterium HGW-Chloroflexi-10]